MWLRAVPMLLIATTLRAADPLAWGQTLSIEHLAANERVLIAYSAVTPMQGGHLERLYQIDGGDKVRFTISDLRGPPTPQGWFGYGKQKTLLAGAKLRSSQAFGLDCFLLFLRRRYGQTGTDFESRTIVGYYRDGKEIGEERFHDGEGEFAGMTLKNGEAVVDTTDLCPKEFPREVYKAIIAPYALERSLLAAPVPVH